MATPSLRAVDPDLPALPAPDRLRKAADVARSLFERVYIDNMRHADLAAQEAWLADYAKIRPALPTLLAEVTAIDRPATKSEIAAALLTLRDTIPPTSGRPATATGNRMMAERVGAREPSFGALQFATLWAIDRLRWYPPPAEMLEILDQAMHYFASIKHALERLPAIERGMIKLVTDERQRRVEVAERLRLLNGDGG